MSKIMNGARAKLGIIEPGKQPRYVGIFNSVSFGLTFDTAPAYILGRYSAASIDYTAQEVIGITASGYRVIDHGAHADGGLPNLKDLLNSEYLTLTIVDRKDPTRNINTFKNVRATGYSTSINARNLEEITVNFTAINMDDETSDNSEAAGSMDLPE
jgi:hypothetical protein